MAQLNDLNDDCLMQVLDRLPPEELLKMQRLNKQMKRLAGVKMRVKIVGMSLWGLNKSFSKCTAHLGCITRDQVMGLIPALASTNLKPFTIEPFCNRVEIATSAFGRANLLDVFSKCSSIKSVDFEMPCDLLLGVIKLCLKIECIKFGRLIKQDEWCRVLDLIGHRLVHVENDFNATEKTEAWPLAMIAEKCTNMKQIDWKVNNRLDREFIVAIKRLPKSCQVNINCFSIDDNAFEDVVDEFQVEYWPLTFSHRTERLATLKFMSFCFWPHAYITGTDFAGLKKLVLMPRKYRIPNCPEYLSDFVDFLVASQFPRLEEFCFNAPINWRKEAYEKVFARMTSLKRLTLVFESHLILPRSAIRRLEKLETIVFEMRSVPMNYQQAELLQEIGRYIEEVNSLKNVVAETIYDSWAENKWQQSFKDGIEKLKQNQSRVAIEFRQ